MMGRRPKYGSQAQTDAERAKRRRNKRRQAKAVQAVQAYSVQVQVTFEETSRSGVVVSGGVTYDLTQATGKQINGFYKIAEELKGLDAEHWYFLTGQTATIEGTTSIALNAARHDLRIHMPDPFDAFRPDKPDKAPPIDPHAWWRRWPPELQVHGGKGPGRVLRDVTFREDGKRVVRRVEASRAAGKARPIEVTDELMQRYGRKSK
jgi:hypothetical protein